MQLFVDKLPGSMTTALPASANTVVTDEAVIRRNIKSIAGAGTCRSRVVVGGCILCKKYSVAQLHRPVVDVAKEISNCL